MENFVGRTCLLCFCYYWTLPPPDTEANDKVYGCYYREQYYKNQARNLVLCLCELTNSGAKLSGQINVTNFQGYHVKTCRIVSTDSVLLYCTTPLISYYKSFNFFFIKFL